MKFGKDEYILNVTMTKYLDDINAEEEHKNKILSLLKEKGYLVGTANSMITGNIPIESLIEIDRYVLLVLMHDTLAIGELNPQNWLTEDEIKEVANYKELPSRETLIFPLVLQNVLEVVEDQQWIMVRDMNFVANLYSAKMIKYDYRTQRDPKLIKKRDKFIKVPNTNAKAVTEIATSIKDKTYTPNTITFNISKEDIYSFSYDKVKKQLTIHEGTINILDGWHRCLAMMTLLMMDEKMKYNFEIRFVNYNEARAAAFVKQEDIRNKISEQHIASIDMSELANSVTRTVNEDIQSDIAGKIVTDRKYITEGVGLTMFKSFSDTVQELWRLDTRTDADNLSHYLIQFFNQLLWLKKPELLNDIKANKRKSYVNHEGMFIFYLTIAKDIQNYANWKDILKQIINKTDFSKKNPFWDALGVITRSEDVLNRFRSGAIKDTLEYVKEVLKDVE